MNKADVHINSPETEFYKKGSMIFNLDKAKNLRSETEEVLIVEGYMDVLSVYSSGIKNVISNSGTALTGRQISLIWKFFSSPIICLDGDESGQIAAFRIAERLFPLINENNRIYFSIMPDGKDPDDYIKENGKNGLISLLKKKEIIQSFIWQYHLQKINQNNPYEVSKFDKEIKKLTNSIQDETLKKYVLEDFLERLRNLTPMQASKQNYSYLPFKKKKDYRILKETKILHQKREKFSKIQIIEFSILYLIWNFFEISLKKAAELSEIEFIDKKNDDFKNLLIKSLAEPGDINTIKSKVHDLHEKILGDIQENSNIQIISKNKTDQDIFSLLDELIKDHRDQCNLKKIESLEQKLINNLDENSYSELIKLKSQLNRD